MLKQTSVCSLGNQGLHKQRKGIFTGGGVEAAGRRCRGGREGVEAAENGVKATQSAFSARHTKGPVKVREEEGQATAIQENAQSWFSFHLWL